jgi:hypothetical protein
MIETLTIGKRRARNPSESGSTRAVFHLRLRRGFKPTTPLLSGAAFRHQFNTDAKIIDVIRSGSVIGRAPIVSMPHWRGIIPPEQLRALTAYIKTLK